jgi:hypothetical protein
MGFVQLQHCLEDFTVLWQEEFFGLQPLLNHRVEMGIVHHDRTEDAAFRVEIVRERIFNYGLSTHGLLSAFGPLLEALDVQLKVGNVKGQLPQQAIEIL